MGSRDTNLPHVMVPATFIDAALMLSDDTIGPVTWQLPPPPPPIFTAPDILTTGVVILVDDEAIMFVSLDLTLNVVHSKLMLFAAVHDIESLQIPIICSLSNVIEVPVILLNVILVILESNSK